MRALLIPLSLLIGCTPAGPGDGKPASDTDIAPRLAGRLEERDLDEASGMARSQRSAEVLWVINDSGKPRLHAIDPRGRDLGRIKVDGARVSDWEDIASFRLDGVPYLLIADIGDNDAERKDVRVYVVEEPDPDDDEVDVAWEFEFSYPDGPRDAEAIVVDVQAGRILVLAKRDIPAVLYELPLLPGDDRRQVAVPVGIPVLPQPRRQDIQVATKTKIWWWQPTAMDLAPDETAAVILTYRGVFYYPRKADEPWEDALRRKPLALTTGDYDNAESITFSADGAAVYLTFEGRGAPVVRIDLNRGDASE